MNCLNVIATEVAGDVDIETFHKYYQYIMRDDEDRHVFMFIDLHKKASHPSGIRINYTDFVVM